MVGVSMHGLDIAREVLHQHGVTTLLCTWGAETTKNERMNHAFSLHILNEYVRTMYN